MLRSKYDEALGLVRWQRRGVEYVEQAAEDMSQIASSAEASETAVSNTAAPNTPPPAYSDDITFTPAPRSTIDLLVVTRDGVFDAASDALLTAMLGAIKFTRDKVVTVKTGLLPQKLSEIRPRMILLFGEEAAQAVLGLRSLALADIRNKIHLFSTDNIPTVATYHPTHLLTNTADKRPAWEDLCLLKKHYDDLLKAN